MSVDVDGPRADVLRQSRDLLDRVVTPNAGAWDRAQEMDEKVAGLLGAQGLLVPSLPEQAGGRGFDADLLGRFNEQAGRACGSVRNLIGVQGMVAHALHRWAKPPVRDRWVPRLAAGDVYGSFALTEPHSGSDARAAATVAERRGGSVVLNGEKSWISFAARAGVFLVFARLDGHVAAIVVERDTPGVHVTPQADLLGLRASHLAAVRFDDCAVPAEHVVAQGPLAFDAVATAALDHGRFSTAWGSVGLAAACLDASLDRAVTRQQFGAPIGDHQLVARMVTRMVCAVDAARMQCEAATRARSSGDRDAVRRTLIAKYVASENAFAVASDAVQVHGAYGCSAQSSVERHLRDAKIQCVIEGTSQIQETQISQLTLTSWRAAQRRSEAPGPSDNGR
ncbi:acyl-CoA dehydrogenase family protein [Micromonospora rifamycinica]|uniref:acyl-CoA dehydrogenase family protein n=1 Tax=Micromonospora rifamycinica TaxID=291594 RepID=UPI0033FB7F20